MKKVLSFFFTLITLWAFGQNSQRIYISRDTISFNSGKRNHQFDEGDTLFTKSGYKFYCHQVLKIGAGSGERGYFNYIFLVNANNTDMSSVGTLFTSVDKTFLQGSRSVVAIKSYNPRFDITASMPPTNSGKEFVVVNLKSSGSRKLGYSFTPVIAEPIDGWNRKKLRLGNERYYIDYENAVNSGELIYAGKQPTNKNNSPIEVKIVQEKNEKISIPDELAKLKKLYDSGAITKEEYDIAKKKLLDKL